MMKTNRWKVGMMSIVGFAFILLAVSCDPGEDKVQPDPVAYVSMYQASPDAPNLSIDVDGRTINTYPFDYADHTGYLRFYVGSRNIRFGPYGADNIVIDTTVDLENLKAYSIFVVDEYSDASLLILNDNSPAPQEGKAKIRFVHVSPDATVLDLTTEGQDNPLIENISFKGASEFMEVNAGGYDFQVTTAGTENVVLSIPDINIQSGWFYTILVRGYNSPPAGNTNLLSGEVIVN